MASFNKVILCGNITRAPELRYTPKGTACCQITVAMNETWTGQDGEKKESVCFADCTAWGKTAEAISQYLRKGDPILIEGRLKLDSWEDKKTNEKRQKLGITIESFSFVGSKKSGDATAPTTKVKADAEPEKDDVPF